jgi:hypothetical protein
MARFKIITKQTRTCNGIRIEKGMSFEVVLQSTCNPVNTNEGQALVDTFHGICGIDIKKAGCLSCAFLM